MNLLDVAVYGNRYNVTNAANTPLTYLNMKKIITSLSIVTLLPTFAVAALQQISTANPSFPGSIIDVATGANNSGGSGWGYQAGEQFLDYFNDNDTVTYDNVTIPALSGGAVLATQGRDGTPGGGRDPQGYRIELFTPGSGYVGAPLHTFLSERYRSTSYGPGGWAVSQVQGLNVSGAFDIRVTSLNQTNDPDYGANAGGHFRGLVAYTPAGVLSEGTTILQDNQFAYGNGNKSYAGPTANSSGTFMDNQLTGAWIDYDVYNPFSELAPVSISVRYRHGMGSDQNFNLSLVDADGDVSSLTSLALPANGWGANFVDSVVSSTFNLPSGFSTIRIGSSGPIHYDYMSVTVVPEPATYAAIIGALLGAFAIIRRRK